MKIKFADKNDRKAVWFWLKDPMSSLFITNKITPDYNKHCKWFDMMCKKDQIIIGIEDNLRIGVGILFLMSDKLSSKILYETRLLWTFRTGFHYQWLSFFFSKHKGKPVYVELFWK